MRDPKVEEFLAHTRLAAEGDAKADFERRVDRKVEAMVEELKGDTVGHAFHGNRYTGGEGGEGKPGTMSRNGQIDHELDRSHSRWTQATSPMASELEKSGFRHALSDQPRAQTGVRAYDRGYDVGLGYKYPATEGQRQINMQRFGSEKLPKLDTRTPAVALVTAPPHNRIGLRDAPAGETKYSDDQPRDDHGRFGVASAGGSRPGKPFAVIDKHDPQGGKGLRRVSFHATGEEARQMAKKLNERNAPTEVHRAGALHFHGGEMHRHEWTAYVGHVHASGGTAKIGGARSPSNHGFAATGPDSPPSRKV